MLELKDIVKIYETGDQKVVALNGLSLSFAEKGFVSILGASGCGKTTLLNIIGGLDRYTEGDLIINGVSTKNYKDKDWDAYRNNSIGFVFQSYNLISHQTVLQNVELALTLSGVAPKERKERATEVLTALGLGDQLDKKPNQLSGGQMQRVAIARAMVNNPDILLADEPTGALDSKNSVQIMELLKDISKDKLVIMVTHNAELADIYSTRIVRLSDGVLVDDTQPVLEEVATTLEVATEAPVELQALPKKREKRKARPQTSMSFWTALVLSLKNLLTKKGRTFITAFAGSIGIIGIAMVLSLSTGINRYITNAQQEFMNSTAISISAETYDLTSMMSQMGTTNITMGEKTFPDADEIYEFDNGVTDSLIGFIQQNNLSDDFVGYLKDNLPKDTYNSIEVVKTLTFNIVKRVDSSYVGMPTTLSNMISTKDFVERNYEVLYGEYSSDPDALTLVVDENNMISRNILTALNFSYAEDTFSFEEVVGREIKIAHNNDFYKKKDGLYEQKRGVELEDAYNNTNNRTRTLTVRAIMRVKNELGSSPVLMSGLYYNPALALDILEEAKTSEIVVDQLASKNQYGQYISVIDGRIMDTQMYLMALMSGAGMGDTNNYTMARISAINADTSTSSIMVYPVDYASRVAVQEVVDGWNATHNTVAEKITYTDTLDTIFSMFDEMMDIVTYALIAFISISLIVSTVMIGVITYVSVIERTKEIGILRSVGARKKDISRVFNAETFIIGGSSGLIGVIVSYLLIIPINLILRSLTGIKGLCYLHPLAAFILVVISICLTLISGLFPARIAAKRDPILALRSE